MSLRSKGQCFKHSDTMEVLSTDTRKETRQGMYRVRLILYAVPSFRKSEVPCLLSGLALALAAGHSRVSLSGLVQLGINHCQDGRTGEGYLRVFRVGCKLRPHERKKSRDKRDMKFGECPQIMVGLRKKKS